ncbi:MAG: hypothetical protein LBI57_07525 [Helicobacteraceae bacterium]|nr:hypothetical protein [Helicobacteraceae bacterium]
MITLLTPERKHRLRCIGEAILLGLMFIVFGMSLLSRENERNRSDQDRLLMVYTVYTELMFADIDDMIYRASRAYFNLPTKETRVLEDIWRERQQEDPLIKNGILLDQNKTPVFIVKKENILDQATINKLIAAPPAPSGFRISEPVMRPDGERSVFFTRVFYKENGDEAGYAIAEFSLKTIAQRYERLTGVGKNAIGLFSQSGAILARAPESKNAYEERVLPDHLLKSLKRGLQIASVNFDGEKRIFSFAAIDAYNMFMVCSASYFETYRRLAPIFGGLIAVWLILSYVNWKISRIILREENAALSKGRKTILELESKAEEALIGRLKAEKSKSEHEKILLQQSKMAAMGEMIGAIAHQWRQPLNAIGLYVQDVLDAHKFNQLNEEYIKDSVDKTMWQLRFMSATINDFRNFFKPDKEKAAFDLSKVVQTSIGLIAIQLKSHDIDFSFEIPGEPLWCYGYENELGQAVLNLINNAKDAILTRRARGKKRIVVVRLTRDDQMARLEVEDNGGGVPAELMDRVFEPYFTTKENGKGTGVGLYMCKMIVEDNMDGKIGVYNAQKGACFYIILPLAKEGLL